MATGDAVERGERMGVADPRAGVRDAQHVRQAGARNVRVDERADGPELRNRAERGQEEGAVEAEDRDRIALGDAFSSQYRGEAVHGSVVRAVGDGLVLELQDDAVGDRLGLLADEGTERIGRPFDLLEDLVKVHGRQVPEVVTLTGSVTTMVAPPRSPHSRAWRVPWWSVTRPWATESPTPSPP